MKPKRILRHSPPILLTLLLLALTGCADLKEIRTFADSAANTASYTGLTHYYLGEFDRSKDYEENPDRQKQLDTESAARHKQEKALLALHRGVHDYMNAIGALASDELVSYDPALTRLGDSIKETKLVDDARVDAYRDLTSFIAKAATDGYRQRKLKQLIHDANPSFQKVTEALHRIVGSNYVLSLDNEAAVMDSYYQETIRTAQKNDPATELVKETWRTKKQDLAARRQACLAYAETIEKIAQGHQEMFNHLDNLNAKITLDTMFGYAQELDELRGKIRELTK